ncbi:MAG: hypothetical protein F2663_08400 [Actinobacteria bacterium]|uniref:Unannotated protein n=1 Tax=freshwater metagenome TaxID=449393 RepID=A0A6J6Q454_9ZZZZ|nr:hypothetical protein [Actinomycetota bacterium]
MRRLTSGLFFATLFCCTFEKVHWNVAGTVSLADLLAICFLTAFLMGTGPRVPRTTQVLLGFWTLFLVSHLIGFFDLQTSADLQQYVKGIVKWLIHFGFLVGAVTWLYRRGQDYYWKSLAVFALGVVGNAAFGVLELLAAHAGTNLDSFTVQPLTGGASQINVYGAVEGTSVFRPNALTGDPNHLGIMIIAPLLVLAPLYLRLERGHRLRRHLGLAIAFLIIVELLTLSRSGMLGLAVGTLVLAVPYRAYLRSKTLLYPLGGAFAILGAVVVSQYHYFEVVFKSRVQTGGGSENAHFAVYSFIPAVIHSHPLFGLGFNTFSVYYGFVTGKTNWGPHSYYVALVVETGLVGTAVFGLFLLWTFARLRRARLLGKALALAGSPLAARVSPLAWGYTAALLGTMASNAFYLTMQFYYFYVLLAFAIAVTPIFSRALTQQRA